MSKELIVSATRHETRVAVQEDDQVTEVFYQRENEYSLAGSIHKGRVTRVLPGMQSAFVDIGLDRDAFLYVSDFFEDNDEYEKIVSVVEDKILKLDKGENGAAPEQAPAELAADGPTAQAASSAAPAEMAQPGASAPPSLRPPSGPEGREQRGRRSRRRRPHGRGLPESKYFSPRGPREGSPERSAPAPERDAPEQFAEAPRRIESTGDFAVLPGESLAKYGPGGRAPEIEKPEAATAPEVIETAIEAAPLATEDRIDPLPVPELAVAIEEPAAPEPAAVEEVHEVASEAEGSSEEAEAEAETGMQAMTDDGAAPPAEASEATPDGASATVREQSPRFLHRVSRRMRRKMRGGELRGDGRDGREARPEMRSAPAADPARTPEARTEVRVEARPEPARGAVRPEKGATPSISDLLKEGQEIIVQIAKEPLGQKGARITSHIALPGRYLVYMPTVDHIGVSRKIPSDDERSRLKRVLQTHRSGIPGGYIVRTAGDGRTEAELRDDMMFLYNLWLDIRQKAEKRPAPALLHHDLDLVERVLRDQFTSSFKSVWVDNEEVYERVLRFVERFQPAMVPRIKLYTRNTPIFDEFNVTPELEKALRPKVWLKSGGYIVINQTEALVAIDINTGKYVGKSARLEDTIVKTNTDAIKEIVRQIRLRDLGGIIVVDFIDMDERKNRQKVMQALEDAMRSDRAPYKILQFNDFGLVAITRKRVKQSLERALCSPCPYCEGAGYVKSVQTVISEILQEAHKIARGMEGSDATLRVNPEIAKILKSNKNDFLQEIEETLGRPVLVKSDPQMHQEKFDLA
ncbi:MAG: Rne/Rng family ribonuclease [Candidatus Solibacter usitatus]|nr:Rne/Rng family ribonuclease [Candidatus Solibacter usitatus]